MHKDPLLIEIENRLPELSWKTSLLPHRMTLSTLPKQLFATSVDNHPSSCVAEIKQDIKRLYDIKQSSQEFIFLAKRVKQKVEVLVRLCQLHNKKQGDKIPSAQLMMRLSRRRQWVEEVEQHILELQQQHQHLQSQISKTKDVQTQLTMQSDLGKLDKKLSILKEQLQQSATF